ncbi:MAG TPA: hypothetical protein VMF06_10110 [Candidatus Limnocylindria bacterium]|nr:hypothetical protein [Candidatus Limnocylindria bacterium]
MHTEFGLEIASDSMHTEVFAEIYLRGKFVALVSQDKGLDHLVIEFPDAGIDESLVLREIDMEEFRRTLLFASAKLSGQSKGE